MISKLQLNIISSFILYIILILVTIRAWMNLMDEQSAFEETTIENERKLPSFTLCPRSYRANKSMESFEDVASEIKDFESKFTIRYSDFDSYIEKPIQEVEKYNNTLGSVWKFIPKINILNPSEDAICLIWTLSKERRLEKKIKVLVVVPFFKVKDK